MQEYNGSPNPDSEKENNVISGRQRIFCVWREARWLTMAGADNSLTTPLVSKIVT